jgi:hypothetical protein
MSVKVDLDQLAGALTDFTFAYLVTVADDYRAHTVAVVPALVDGTFEIGTVGNSTRRNLAQHDGVTLVWPPRDPGGYSLIVDGTGQPKDDRLRIAPTRAVLHRPAAPATPAPPAAPATPATATACLHDCVPLEGA